jgi:spectinomycin phosphotransferase
MNRTTDDILIIDCLSGKYGIVATTLTLLPLGADMNAAVYKAETSNRQSYFVKLKRGHQSAISVTLLGLLQASGIQQIISLIKTSDGKLTERINDFTLTVYPFINGQNGFCHHLTDDQWVALGKALKQVHDLDLPPSAKV